MLNLISVSELSDRLKISKATIYRWIHHKKIPYVKLGGRVLFNPEEVQNFISKNSVSIQ